MAWAVHDALGIGGNPLMGTTEGTNMIKMVGGTAPVGTISLSSVLYSSTTVPRKILANGTDSAIET